MKDCIICRESKSDFNVEHVIPDSIGGTMTIDTVCEVCNSKLGSKVDNHLVEHFFCIVKREELHMRSQNKNLPNSFEHQEYHLRDNANQIVKLDKVKNRFELKPEIDKTSNYVSFDINDTKNIERFCTKHNIDISLFEKENVSDQLTGNIKIDNISFSIALFKIAYEFAIKEIPAYYEDEMAKIISSIIYDTAYSKDKIFTFDSKNIKYHTSLLKNNFSSSFQKYFELSSNNHLMILFSTKELGLVCNIKIFDIFYFMIQLSENQFNIGTIVYENNLGDANSKTESLIEFIVRKNVCSITKTICQLPFPC